MHKLDHCRVQGAISIALTGRLSIILSRDDNGQEPESLNLRELTIWSIYLLRRRCSLDWGGCVLHCRPDGHAARDARLRVGCGWSLLLIHGCRLLLCASCRCRYMLTCCGLALVCRAENASALAVWVRSSASSRTCVSRSVPVLAHTRCDRWGSIAPAHEGHVAAVSITLSDLSALIVFFCFSLQCTPSGWFASIPGRIWCRSELVCWRPDLLS